MSSSNLLPYYPTYQILDEVLAVKNYKNLIIYMDVKNNLQSTYMEHAVINILENSKGGRFLDTSPFSAVMSFLGWHKSYALKKGINIHFILFFETGKSSYHINIFPHYKISRRLDELYGLDRSDRELFNKTMQSNFMLLENAGNQLPNVNVIRMNNLEADFIPYYLTTRELVPKDGVCHLIYSNDHDMWQSVSEDVYVFYKTPNNRKIIKKGEALSNFFSQECKLPDCYLPIAMGITGDSGDDVPGVGGVGKKRLFPIFEQIIDLMGGDIEIIYSKIRNGEKLFSEFNDKNKNKYLNIIIEKEHLTRHISRSISLVSFELISKFLDEPIKTETLDKRKHIENILNNDKKTKKESLKLALEKCHVVIENEAIDFIYV